MARKEKHAQNVSLKPNGNPRNKLDDNIKMYSKDKGYMFLRISDILRPILVYAIKTCNDRFISFPPAMYNSCHSLK
jgi:hypothetical protein